MTTTLLRSCPPLAWLVLLLLAMGLVQPARATHLLGGEMTYRYLDANGPTTAPHRYEITLTVYNTCGAAAIRPSATVGIYNQSNGARLTLTTTNYSSIATGVNAGAMNILQTSIDACTTPTVPPGCTTPATTQSYQLQKFIGIVNLPASTLGYYALWTDGNRNANITNISNPSDYEYMTLYSTLAPPSRPNSSPVFVEKAVANLCFNDTTTLLNNAVDADGDRLEYSLAQPYGITSTTLPTTFAPAPALVPYASAQYTATTPLGTGAGNYAGINLNTGIAKYRTTGALGNKYVVAIDVKEYRTIAGQSVLIGITRRDLQLSVVTCPNVVAPVLPTAATTNPVPRAYTLEVGNTLTIPLTVSQADNHPLTLTLSSVLLDGPGGFNATFNNSPGTVVAGNPSGTAAVASTSGPASGNFVYVAGCNDARATPYDVTVTVKDEGCAGKLAGDVLRITVVKPTGRTAATGNFAVCGLNTTQSYSATGGTAPLTSWRIVGGGGTFVGGNVGNPVQITWSTAGTFTLIARGMSQYGCLTDSVTKTVVVTPSPTLTVTGNRSICPGASTTLTVTTGTAPYTITGGAAPITGAGPFVLSPSQTTTYTIADAVAAGGCPGTAQVTVTVLPTPTADAGAARSICSGASTTLGGAPVAGTTYSWSPATGLSNPGIANPTVTLTNSTGTPTTQTYTLTVSTTATQCTSSGTVAVTVLPLPVANAGAAVALCSGSSAQLGGAPVPGYTYSWSPATGLSNPSIANPTVTLTNSTGTPITQAYTLTVTSVASCVSTGTVVVTVNQLSVVLPGAPVAFCSGSSAQLGAPPVAGYTYSWSPATGLSNPNIANPTVTLMNTTGAATTQTYTLTTTSAATSCLNTNTVAVTVYPPPVANVGAAVALCSGGTAQLGSAPVPGYTYSWSPATGLSSPTAANPTVTLTNTTTASTTQAYTLTVTSATGCVNTGTVLVKVNPLPIASPGVAATICSGGTTQLGNAPVPGLAYSWSPTTGLSSPTVANPTATLTNSTGADITQTYTLTVTDQATACTGTSAVVITVNPVVRPGGISADQTVCAGSTPAPLTSTAPASGGPGPSTYSYQWESSPDNVTWKAIGNATALAYAPGPVAGTTYFRRRVTAGQCGMAYTSVVTVQTQPLLIPAVQLPTLPAQCAGTAFTFTPVPTNAGAAPTYRWLVNGTQVATGPVYTSTTLADGDLVQVELTPTVGFCASGVAIATSRVSLKALQPPTAAIALQTTMPVCVGAPITVGLDRATNAGLTPQYQWQVDGADVAGATSASFTSATLRNGQAITLALRVTNDCGQVVTATSNAVRVIVNPPVHVSAGPDKTITEGESVVLEGEADGNYPVVWTPSKTLVFASGSPLRPVATPAITTVYTLAAGAGYCADLSTVTVTVKPRVTIPNAFTPNGDGDDDSWQIDHIGEYPSNHVLVFNRWGGKIFEASNYNRSNEWNGTVNGQPAAFGTYYYVITLGNGKSYTGPLTVMR